MVEYITITLLQIVCKVCDCKILKIGQYLAKIWTKVKWHVFIGHSACYCRSCLMLLCDMPTA